MIGLIEQGIFSNKIAAFGSPEIYKILISCQAREQMRGNDARGHSCLACAWCLRGAFAMPDPVSSLPIWNWICCSLVLAPSVEGWWVRPQQLQGSPWQLASKYLLVTSQMCVRYGRAAAPTLLSRFLRPASCNAPVALSTAWGSKEPRCQGSSPAGCMSHTYTSRPSRSNRQAQLACERFLGNHAVGDTWRQLGLQSPCRW